MLAFVNDCFDEAYREAGSFAMRYTMDKKTSLATTMLIALAAVSLVAQSNPPEGFNTDDSGLAIQGYDPVAYFTRNAAVQGDPAIQAEYEGVLFSFATEEHREQFLEDPQAYLPQYGGWCAWAAARGSLAEIDPTQFVIHNGRLFLNYSGFVNLRFRARLEHNIEQADVNWPTLVPEAAGR
jgi:YHS domain-containing protein